MDCSFDWACFSSFDMVDHQAPRCVSGYATNTSKICDVRHCFFYSLMSGELTVHVLRSPGLVRVCPERRREASGVVWAAAAEDACSGERRLLRGDQGSDGKDSGRGAEQMVSQNHSLYCSNLSGVRRSSCQYHLWFLQFVVTRWQSPSPSRLS